MSVAAGRRLPLLDRPREAMLFHRPDGPVSAARFLAEAAGLARRLPAAEAFANLCQDRYRFALGFAAAALQGALTLLPGDLSPRALTRLAEEQPGAIALTDAGMGAPGGFASFEIGDGPCAEAAGMPELPADQPVLLVLTSGSTGAATATCKRWGELVARTRAAGARFALAETEAAGIVGTVPPHHMYGLETTVLLPLHAAACAWCGPAFYPADVARALAAMHPRAVLVTTPLHLHMLHEAGLIARPARVISATAPLSPSLAAAVEGEWGAPVLEIFGASEVGSIASRRTVEGEEWSLYPGLALAGSGEAPVVSAPDAEPRPLADVLALTPGGFRLLGRRADLVKLGGRRASLAGLTRILASVEGVQDAAFMAPDDLEQRRGARLAAFAVAPGRTAAELTRVLRREIEPVFLPRPLVLVDALPRNATGKLPRADLLALLAGATR